MPPETRLYCAHEYTQANARFAATVDPGNEPLRRRIAEIAARRARFEATVPSILRDELETNPFLRAADPGVQETVGMRGALPMDVFAEIRRRKDHFR